MVVEEDENVFLELPEARNWQGIFATVSGLNEIKGLFYRPVSNHIHPISCGYEK